MSNELSLPLNHISKNLKETIIPKIVKGDLLTFTFWDATGQYLLTFKELFNYASFF